MFMTSIITSHHPNITTLSGVNVIERIVTGGQTGVDRAALDAAIRLGICYGGWCPKGRIDERGIIPGEYDRLVEIMGVFSNDKENYDARTRANIRDSDGTLIIIPFLPIPTYIQDGTLLTIREAEEKGKPFLLMGLEDTNDDNLSKCIQWITENNITTLNLAGPRESSCPGIHDAAFAFLLNLIPALQTNPLLSMCTRNNYAL